MTRVIVKAEEHPDHILFRLRENGRKVFKKVPFLTYFYLLEEDVNEAMFLIKNFVFKQEDAKDRDGNDFVKIYLKDNTHRYIVKNKLDEADIQNFELDVPAHKRFLIDNQNIELNQDKLHIAWMDIETLDLKPFQKNFKGEIEPVHPILSIAVKDKENGEEFYVRNSGLDDEKFESLKELRKNVLQDPKNIELNREFNEYYGLIVESLEKDEPQLLRDYINIISDNFDVASAYNGCFLPKTRISMYNGKTKNIEDIKVGDFVVGMRNNKSVKTKVKHVFKHKDYKKVYEITTKHSTFMVTEEHPFLVSYSDVFDYKKVSELREGDYLVEFKKLNYKNPKHDYDIEDYLFAGLIITDGHLPVYSKDKLKHIDFSNTDKKIRDIFEDYITKKGLSFYVYKHQKKNSPSKPVYRYRVKSKKLRDMLVWMGVPEGRKSLDCFVDLSNIYIQDEKRISSFLNGCYLGDGTKYKKKEDDFLSCYNLTMASWFYKLYKRLGKNIQIIKGKYSGCNTKEGIRFLTFDEIPKYFIKNIKKGFTKSGHISDILDGKCTLHRDKFNKYFYSKEDIDDFRFEKILSIREINYGGYVYNFETGTNNYVAENKIVHNCSFDFKYIIERCKKYGMDYHELMMVDFDYMECYKKNNFEPRRSFSLNNVAKVELKGTDNESNEEVQKVDWKEKTDALKIFDLYFLYPEVLKEYNIQDVRLMDMIEKKLNYFNIHFAQSKFSHCFIIDTLFNSLLSDVIVLNEYKKYNLIAISKPSKEEKMRRENEDTPSGGFVRADMKGLHNFVEGYDFLSQYPTIGITYNISPETYIRKVYPDLSKVFDEKELEYINYCVNISKKYIDKTDKLNKKKYESDIEQKRIELEVDDMETLMYKFIRDYDNKIKHEENECFSPADINYDKGWNIHPHCVYSTSKEGIYPKIWRELIEQRNIFKSLMRDFKDDKIKFREFYDAQLGVKINLNCFSLDTEIMTVDGAKNVCDIKKGDKVFSFNMETNEVEEATVINEIIQEHSGEMVHFKNKNVDLIVTPNHRMVRKKYEASSENYFCEAKKCMSGLSIPLHKRFCGENVPDYLFLFDLIKFEDYDYFLFKDKNMRIVRKELKNIGIELKYKLGKNVIRSQIFNSKKTLKKLLENGYDVRMRHKRSSNCSFEKCKIFTDDFSKIIGWYIADGCSQISKPLLKDNVGRNGTSKIVMIGKREHTNGWKEIKTVLERCWHHVTVMELGFYNSNDLWYELLNKCGVYGYEKHIPNEYKNIVDNEVLFNSMYMCDGTSGRHLYSTTSEALKNQLKELCFKIGRSYNAKLVKYNNKKRKDVWRIFCSPLNLTKKINKENISEISGHNKVACITLDKNNTVYAGRNNTFVWTGQSLYGFLLFKGSRHYKYELGNTITTSGRYHTKRAILFAKNLGHQLTLADTDGIYIKTNVGRMDTDELDKLYFDFFNEMIKDFNTKCEIELTNPRTKQKEICNHFIVFEHEKTLDYLIVIKKKRYYFTTENGKVVSIGGYMKRSDTNPLGAELQEELINDIFSEKFDENVWVEKIKEVHRKCFNFELEEKYIVKSGGVNKPLEEYGQPVIDGKTGEQKKRKSDGAPMFAPVPAGVQVAKRMFTKGVNFDVGDKVEYVVLENPPIKPISVEEYRESKVYDASYYYEKIVKPLMEIIMAVYPEKMFTTFKDSWNMTERQIKSAIKKINDDEEEK